MRWGTSVSMTKKQEIDELGGSLVNDKVSVNEYASLYSKSSVAVLPYQTYSHYIYQTSGRLLDALALGCKVVVPSDTVLARITSNMSHGVSASPFDAKAISRAISALLKSKDYSELPLVRDAADTAIEIVSAANRLDSNARITPQSTTWGDTFVASQGFLLASPRGFVTGLLSIVGFPMAKLARLLAFLSHGETNRIGRLETETLKSKSATPVGNTKT